MKVSIERSQLIELKRKAKLYDAMIANNSRAGKTSASRMTAEQRRDRAKKAVAARIAKYNQKVVK